MKRGISWETVNLDDIDRRLQNIRAFPVRDLLDESEIRRSLIPMVGPFLDHLMSVLFADAVRWWAAAHRSGQDKNKFLQWTMYKGDLVSLCEHFNHGFRNNQLAHFPGGKKSNDVPWLIPTPYGFALTTREYKDFTRLLSNAIAFTLGAGMDKVNLRQMVEQNPELRELVAQLTPEENSTLESALADHQSNPDMDEKRLQAFRDFLQKRRGPTTGQQTHI